MNRVNRYGKKYLSLEEIDKLALRTIKTGKILIRVVKCLTIECTSELKISCTNSTGYCRKCTPVFGKKKPYEALYNTLLSTAKYRGILCDLTYQQFYLFCVTEKNCAYCGVDVNRLEYSRGEGLHGKKKSAVKYVDRKNSSGPYHISNMVTCCKECNLIKHVTLSYDEMLLLMRLRKIRGELCLSH